MECAGVQHDSVANVKPHCAYLPEIASKNFINKEERNKWLQDKCIPEQSPKPIGRPKGSTGRGK